MNERKRTDAEKRLVKAAEEVLDESRTEAAVLKIDGERVVAAGDEDALPVVIELGKSAHADVDAAKAESR